jgi:hypothetical protein
MDYFCALSITDLFESNRKIPDALFNSPLVVFYMLYDVLKKISCNVNALKFSFYIARKAWNMPTSKGVFSTKERVIDALSGIGSQLFSSSYLDLCVDLAYSTKWLQGTFERLYKLEKNTEIKKQFKKYISRFT